MSEVHVTDSTFSKEVLEHDGLVLVDFWAPWCGPCRMLEPVIAQLAEEAKEKVKVCKMNVDEEREVAGKFGIMSIPTIMLFKKGEVVESMIGLQSKEAFMDAVNRNA
jgi:thioredoxin 1